MVPLQIIVYKQQVLQICFRLELVPEKVIQDFTEHRSIKALRQYERVDVTQKRLLATS